MTLSRDSAPGATGKGGVRPVRLRKVGRKIGKAGAIRAQIAWNLCRGRLGSPETRRQSLVRMRAYPFLARYQDSQL